MNGTKQVCVRTIYYNRHVVVGFIRARTFITVYNISTYRTACMTI